MGVLAVKEFVRSQAATVSLTGTVWGNKGGKVDAWRQRPKAEKLGTNIVITVGRVKLNDRRKTTPRGFGERLRHYDVELLVYAEHQDEQVGGDDFDIVVERLIQTLLVANVPGVATDPTGRDPATTLFSVMENGPLLAEVLDPSSTAPQGRVRFYAMVTANVSEILIG